MAAQTGAALRYEPVEEESSFARDVIAGLTARPKRLPPKYFYDEAGAQLFEEITRAAGILPDALRARDPARACAPTSRGCFPPASALIEFGSGSSKKVRILLAAAPTIAAYVPVDISAEMLAQEADELRRDYPQLAVLPVEADFTQAVRAAGGGRRHGAGRLLPGLDHRQFRAARGLRRSCATPGACSGAARR